MKYACALLLIPGTEQTDMKTFYQISSGLTGTIVLGKRINDINYNQVKFNSVTRIILLCIILLLSSYEVPGGEIIMTEEMRFQTERALFYFQIKDQPFSEELLKKCMYYERITHQDIVILQSRLETGYYTSDIFLNGHNCFGMKFPKYRPTIATGTYKEHAQYSYWFDSVIDYALWQEWYLSLGYRIGGSDNNLYLIFLNCIPYAENPRYVTKLVEMSQRDMT
jgi:hypothetical protein